MSAHAGCRLRQLMMRGCVAAPGAFNGLVARLTAEAGFKACYISGAAVSGAMGLPDIGVIGQTDFTKVIREVTKVSGLPCVADADTGFGGTEMVRRTVFEYSHAGAAGLHIEDQTFPKRCGHLEGKTLVPITEMSDKVRCAVKASQDASEGAFIVCARTDARSVEGLDAAIDRAATYVADGAHMIFPEGLQSADEFRQFAKAMSSLKGEAPQGGPFLLANMTEFGQSPLLKVSELEALGYNIVIFPVTTLRSAMKPVQEVLAAIMKDGTVEGEVPKMYSRKELYSSLGYTPGREWEYPSETPNLKRE